jgi:hypothetical protein
MCLVNATKIETDKDIIGYKIEYYIKKENKWVSYFYDFEYEMQKLYILKTKINIVSRSWDKFDVINEGFHCFKYLEDAEKFVVIEKEYFSIHGYVKDIRIVECIIPFNAEIYYGCDEGGIIGYASNKIIINKVIAEN